MRNTQLGRFGLALLGPLLVCACSSSHYVRPEHATLTTVQQIRDQPLNPSARVPVRLRGTITYLDTNLRREFLQDETGGVRIKGLAYGTGSQMEITGQVISGGKSPVISVESSQTISSGPEYPNPVPVTAGDLRSEHFQYQWVQLHGVVVSAVLEETGALDLRLRVDGKCIDVRAANIYGLGYESWIDAELELRGVLVLSMDARGEVTSSRVLVPDRTQIRVLQPATPVNQLALQTVADLQNLHPSAAEHRIRLRGRLESRSSQVVITDQTGALAVKPAPKETLSTGRETEIVGFLRGQKGSLQIEEAAEVKARTAPPDRVLKTVKEVHTLSEAEAKRQYRVSVQAVVTYFNPVGANLFVQDETDGIYVYIGNFKYPSIHVGDLVQVNGISAPGDFAPVIANPHIAVIGKAPLPKPVWIEPEKTLEEGPESRWTEAQGTVYSVDRTQGRITLGVISGPITFKVEIATTSGDRADAVPLFSRVRVQGVYGPFLNFRRQFSGLLIYCPSLSFLKILDSRDGRTPQLRSASQLLQYSPDTPSSAPVRVRGTVVLTTPKGPTYLVDSSGTTCIENHSEAKLQVGDEVEASGFVSQGPLHPVLRYSELRVVGHHSPPPSVQTTADDILDSGADSELVSVDGYLVDRVAGHQDQTLVLQARNLVFSARIMEGTLPRLEPGSLLRVTGVSSIEAPGTGQDVPKRFSLMLRSPQDVVVLASAPWWSGDRGRRMILAFAVAIMAALAWVGLLRRRVRLQTKDLRRATEVAEQANRDKSQFLANMSHEIRTPMNGILGITDLLASTDLNREQKELVGMVKSSADTLLVVLNDILDYSKIEAGKLLIQQASFNLSETVFDAVKNLSLLARNKGVELLVDIDPKLPERLIGDPNRIRQVLTNLVGNAVKFTIRGEIIVRISTGPGPGKLSFAVTDTGIGIPEDKRTKLFQPFEQVDASTTRQFGGTGLGLAISSHLVELMGGQISVASVENVGSTFTFTLPLITGGEPERVLEQGTEQYLRGMRVLIVDDNAANRHILSTLTRNWEMVPSEAEDGEQGFALLKEAAANKAPFRLVLTDEQMPAMGGFELFRHIRSDSSLSTTPILMLSSGDQATGSKRLHELGISNYVVKPIRSAELLISIKKALGRETTAGKSVSQQSKPEPQARLRILLVEDNHVNQRLAVGLLKKLGHDVLVAGNGQQGVELAQDPTIDLVFMDVQMPEMDGFEATCHIREREQQSGRHVPIIAMTAHAMIGDRERCLESGMDDYIAKPLSKAAMENALARNTLRN